MKTIHEKLCHHIKVGNLIDEQWFAFNCAKSVAHLSKDDQVAAALRVVEQYLREKNNFNKLMDAIESAAYAAYVADYDNDAAASAAADAAAHAARAAFSSDASHAADAASAACDAHAAYAADAARDKQHAELDALIKKSEEVQK